MFGKNPVEKVDPEQRPERLRVVKGSPFLTIQGEGPYSGHPAAFVRLHGCPLRCFFCDTEFSDPENPWVKAGDLASQILDITERYEQGTNLVVVTGGEPLRQPLHRLFEYLLEFNHELTIQIETAGLFWQEVLSWPNVCTIVSPKTPVVDEKVAAAARAFKYVIREGDQDFLTGLPFINTQIPGGIRQRLAPPPAGTPVYLSPMDEYEEERNKLNRQAVAKTAMKFGYIAGLQVHKYLELP